MQRARGLYAGITGALGLAVLLVACGGGEPTPAPTTAPTRAVATAAPTTAFATPTSVPGRPTPAATSTPVPATATAVAPAGSQPKYGGALQARVARDWPSWDTYHAAGGHSTVFVMQLMSNLIRFTKDSLSTMEGDLAEGWELGGDGKTYTIKLRRDVKWNDGKPFISADVLYNLRRAGDPKFNFNRERVAVISGVDAPDSYTVKITLKNTSLSFLANVAGPFMLMYPAHIPDLVQWQKSPVGTGPFVFQVYNKDATYVFTRNSSFYGKDAAGRSLPYLDEITYHVIVDKGFGLAAFRAGRLHCGCGHDQDFMTENEQVLRKEIPGVKLGRAPGSPQGLQFNVTRPPFDNLAFRQALAIGVDKEKVASIFRGGGGFRPVPPLFPPELGGQWGLPKNELVRIPGFNPDHSVDVAIAERKFKESGIDPKTISLEVILQDFYTDLADLLSTVVSELGVKVRPAVLKGADDTQRRTEGAFELAFFTGGITVDDPGDSYSQFVLKNGPLNHGRWVNDRVNQLLIDQDAELDLAKRRAMLWEVQRIHLTEFPNVTLWWASNVRGTRAEVFNYQIPPVPVHAALRLDEVWLGQP